MHTKNGSTSNGGDEDEMPLYRLIFARRLEVIRVRLANAAGQRTAGMLACCRLHADERQIALGRYPVHLTVHARCGKLGRIVEANHRSGAALHFAHTVAYAATAVHAHLVHGARGHLRTGLVLGNVHVSHGQVGQPHHDGHGGDNVDAHFASAVVPDERERVTRLVCGRKQRVSSSVFGYWQNAHSAI